MNPPQDAILGLQAAINAPIARTRKEVEDKSWEEQQYFVLSELKKIYKECCEPLERDYAFDQFKPANFSDQLLTAIPMVMFLGPFSAGKSTFINYLLGGDYLWTGPEPTTNKYTVVFHGNDHNTISGRIMAANMDLPFRGTQAFGDAFLEGFSGVQVPSELLKSIMLVDSPGVLETSDSHQRAYDYVGAMRWFVERADLIFVMFDPTKLDSGKELKAMFQQGLKGHESRVRIVLNKADSIGQHELMKVHGALFWNLSNLINTTEPPRVYVSSFWSKPYNQNTNHQLFESEKRALMYDLLHAVPMEALDRKVAALLKRTQEAVIHACIVGTARSKLPSLFGKKSAKKETIDNIDQVYGEVAAKYRLSQANFPPDVAYKKWFCQHDLYRFEVLKDYEKRTGLIAKASKAMEKDIPLLLQSIKSDSSADPRKSKLLQSMTERQKKEAQANEKSYSAQFTFDETKRDFDLPAQYHNHNFNASPQAAVAPTPTPHQQPQPPVYQVADIPPPHVPVPPSAPAPSAAALPQFSATTPEQMAQQMAAMQAMMQAMMQQAGMPPSGAPPQA